MANPTNRPADISQRLKLEFKRLHDRIDRNTGFDGTQLTRTVQKLEELVDGLLEQTDINATGNATIGGFASIGSTLNVAGAAFFPEAYANPVTVSYFAAYLNGDNRLGRTVSSRRYKRDIQNWAPEVQAFFALRLVTYRLRVNVTDMGKEAPTEWGLIAEELVDLGLGWLVIYVDGVPEGIAYEKIGAALIPVVQNLHERLAAQDARIEALEARVGS